MSVTCPHCRARITEDRISNCPKCGRPLPADTSSFLDDFPAPLLAFCVGAVLIILFLILSLAVGPLWSGVMVGLATVGIAAYWNRAAIAHSLRQRRRRAAERRQLAQQRRAAEAAEKLAQETPPAEQNAAAATEPASPVPVTAPSPAPAVLPAVDPLPATVPPPAAAASPPPAEPAQPSAPLANGEPTGADDLTAGLPERYRPFLLSAMTRAEWQRSELEREAGRHELSLDEALRAIGQWSQERFNDTLLVEEGENVRIQLPLL